MRVRSQIAETTTESLVAQRGIPHAIDALVLGSDDLRPPWTT